jgi:flagellin FlaB
MAKKGIVGIEAAIVLIAFVIVAAALAFVVINMGMYTTQKCKEVMQQGLNEATTALEIDGSVLGYGDNTGITSIYIPLKVSPG